MHYAVSSGIRSNTAAGHSYRNSDTFCFPVRIKASRLIKTFRCDCSLIVLLCVVVKLQYRLKKVNVTAIQLQAWTDSEVSSTVSFHDFMTIGT